MLPFAEKSEAGPVKKGLKWKSTNFAFLQAATTLEEIFRQTDAFECISTDPSGAGEAVCKGVKNSLITVIGTIHAVANLVSLSILLSVKLLVVLVRTYPLNACILFHIRLIGCQSSLTSLSQK